MKNSEIKRLRSLYMEAREKQKKRHADTHGLSERLREIERRYFHETGRTLKSDLQSEKED